MEILLENKTDTVSGYSLHLLYLTLHSLSIFWVDDSSQLSFSRWNPFYFSNWEDMSWKLFHHSFGVPAYHSLGRYLIYCNESISDKDIFDQTTCKFMPFIWIFWTLILFQKSHSIYFPLPCTCNPSVLLDSDILYIGEEWQQILTRRIKWKCLCCSRWFQGRIVCLRAEQLLYKMWNLQFQNWVGFSLI